MANKSVSSPIQSSLFDRIGQHSENRAGRVPSDVAMPGLQVNWTGRVLWIGLVLFALALALRLLFLQSLPDPAGSYNPYYSGDTPTWLDYAKAVQASRPFDLGLPLRPPGVAYLVAWLWNGQDSGLLFLKLAWSLMGAGAVAFFYLATLRSFDLRTASVATLIVAASTGLMILSSSPNNETPYLLLVIGSFTLWEPLRHRPRLAVLTGWALLHGVACLIRVEHVLFFALVSAYLLWAWSRSAGLHGGWKPSLGRGLLLVAFFALPLLPWQLHIFNQVERFNREPLPMEPATEQAYLQLEQALGGLPWSIDAEREREALPAFLRRPLSNFVAATVAVRGGAEVTGDDFRIIEEAFGSRPEPIAEHPFVTIYGGLNFCLANNPFASGGFTRAPLEVPPPLTGGASRYPGFLVAGLPPPDLAFSYPPHLEIVNHGYRLGWDWILSHPGDYVSLAFRKLSIFWSGTTLGFTGYNLPLGISGIRRAVDLVVPEGGLDVALWRGAGLVILLLGLWFGRREEALVPWLLLLATKVITTVAFFGYAREGAVVIPVFALLIGLIAGRGIPRLAAISEARRWFLASCALALVLVAVEAYRWHSQQVVTLDGRQVGVGSPFPEPDYEDRRLEVK